MGREFGRRYTWALGLALAVVPSMMAAQASSTPAVSGVAGGFNSRFIPMEIFSRMLERPEDNRDLTFKIAAPVDSVWVALTDVMKQFDIPVGYADRAAGEMGMVKTKTYKRLAKTALSDFLRCGEGSAGPNADMYVVYVSVATFVKAATGGETAVAAFIGGDAVDLPNGRNDVVPCTSSGQFEAKFATALKKRMLNQIVSTKAKPAGGQE